ncbi:MAG: DUF2808 domain-containing protein [Leptolyngbyaceae cyanobacterium SM2_5_2]|nr:DUF2808 domain-containing protein [Leptolyngbyaceae cyanobacterium SM2_5_2]
MTNYRFMVAFLAGVSLLPLTATPWRPQPGAAIQYSDGTIGFSYPPRLTDSYATRNLVSDRNVTYYLTFDFPSEAQEPLAKIEITLDEGRDPIFRYWLEATEAFVNTPEGQVPLPLGELSQDPDTKTLTIALAPPVAPGQSITLALRPVQNPRFAGVYLFGARAFPAGDTVRPTFMGYARLSFYERDGFDWT